MMTAEHRRIAHALGVAAILCIVATIPTHAVTQPRPQHPAAEVQASLQRKHPRPPIPQSFLGFSVEWGLIDQLITPDHGRQQTMIHLMNRLKAYNGPLVVRIGGMSQDEATYNLPKHPHLPDFVHVNISDHTLQLLSQLAAATDCKFVLGLNLADNRPDLAKELVQKSNRIIGSQNILAYEIGNEPDDLNRLGKILRPNNVQSYLERWNRYYKTIRSSLANPSQVAGPSFAGGWDNHISHFIKREHVRLKLVMLHRYPIGASVKDPNSPQFASIPNLLKNSAAASFARLMKPAVAAAKPYHIPVRYGEMNSAYGGGKKNVSDTFASALWGADTLFEIAKAGGVGADFHMSQGFDNYPGYYAPVYFQPNQPLEVRPLFYGMELFGRAVQNNAQLLPVDYHTKANVKLWATEDTDHVIRMVILNKALHESAKINLTLRGYGKGRIVRLHAPAATSKHHVIFGDQTFDGGKSGLPRSVSTNQAADTVTAANEQYTLKVPHVSAAMVVFTPR